ncbi:MAG TPA: DNA gyrase inhibitor YacG [Rhizomicrobium sp.]
MSPPNETSAGSCAICGKPQDPQFRPFCSKRCADIDLGRWLKGNYVIPGGPTDEGDQAPVNDVEEEQ